MANSVPVPISVCVGNKESSGFKSDIFAGSITVNAINTPESGETALPDVTILEPA